MNIILNVKTVNHGFESLRYLGSKIWKTIPSHLKEIDSLNNFKNAIKKWKQESCPCQNIYSKHSTHVDLYRKRITHFF